MTSSSPPTRHLVRPRPAALLGLALLWAFAAGAAAPAPSNRRASGAAPPPARPVAPAVNTAAAPEPAPQQQQPTSVLPGRPDQPAGAASVGGAGLGDEVKSLGLGLSLRAPRGMVAARRVGSGDVIEFYDEPRQWTLKVSKTKTQEPSGILTWRDKAGIAHPGLLDSTLAAVSGALGKHEVLRQDLINIGAHDVGMLALRYNEGGQTWLTQQAIIQASDTMYYLIALKTPVVEDRAGAAPATRPAGAAPAISAGEREAVQTFRQVLDTVQILDLTAVREDQNNRLYATRALLVNFTPKHLHDALIPQQWLRIVRDGKDVGYTYVIEEQAAGIPDPLTAEQRKAGKTRPEIEPGDGVLIGMRTWRAPAKEGAPEIEAESWMYVSPDLRHEDWSQGVVARQPQADPKADPVIDFRTEFGSSDRRRTREGRDEYLLNVTIVARRENPKPVARVLPPFYLTQAIGQLLPRLVPLNHPKGYLFYSYVSDQQELVARYIDVLPEARVTFNGQLVRAVQVTDKFGIEGSVTTHYMTPEGQYLGSENKDTKLLVLPTDEQTLLGLWKDAKLTDPQGIDRRNRPQIAPPAGGAQAAAQDSGTRPGGRQPARPLRRQELSAPPSDLGLPQNGGTGTNTRRNTSAAPQRLTPAGGAGGGDRSTYGGSNRGDAFEPRGPRAPRDPGDLRDSGDRRDPRDR